VRFTPANPLVLGSASPRRRDLLAMLRVPFVVQSASADETALPDELPLEYVRRVARAKLDAVRAGDLGSSPGVLVADTIVVAPDGSLLGKPRSDDEGVDMIARLAGATHHVSTHFALGASARGVAPIHAQTVTTRVAFRPLALKEIRDYVASGEGRDKAGSYAVQGDAAAFVERIEGSFTNVVGLPVCEVLLALRAIGWLESP
jgi:septum formation protein